MSQRGDERGPRRRGSHGGECRPCLLAVRNRAGNASRRTRSATGRLAVYNLEGQFYVTDDECTHASASLADGFLEDGIIECSLHSGAFDVKTGAVKSPPCSFALRTYKVVLQGDDVFVDLDKDAAGEPA